jgi:predicted outer membrane protein
MISTLSLTAYAAQPSEGQNPDQIPAETEVNVKDTREVIQVLYVSNTSEIEIANLVRERNPDESLQNYADELIRDHETLISALKELADVKSISLKEGELEQPAQLVDTMMDKHLQNLAQRPQEEFRSAFLEASIMSHQKTLEFFSKIEQGNSDDALKAIIAVARQAVEKHLADAQKLKAEIQQPGTEPAQPAE